MRTQAPWTEHFQQVQSQLREEFWGDFSQQTPLAWQQFVEGRSVRERDQYLGLAAYERAAERGTPATGSIRGTMGRASATRRVRIARTRPRAFLPADLARFPRRAPDVALLIRAAFLRGLSTRQVGRVVALRSEEPVSAPTVSQLTRDLARLVAQFHQAPRGDEGRSLCVDGVSLRVRRPAGRKRGQLLVA